MIGLESVAPEREVPSLAMRARSLRVDANEPASFIDDATFTVSFDESQVATNTLTSEAAQLSDNVKKTLLDVADRCRRQAERYPEDPRAWVNFGLACINGELLYEAARAFERALELDPEDFAALMNHARVFALRGQSELAKQAYERLVALYPENPDASIALALTAAQNGNQDAAARLLNETLRSSSNEISPRGHLAILMLQLGRHREAIQHLKEAVRADPRSAELSHALGAAYSLYGDTRQAMRSYRTALFLNPESDGIVRDFATALIEHGAAVSAVDILAKWLDEHAADWRMRELLARALYEAGEPKRARYQLVRTLETVQQESLLDPGLHARILNNVGACDVILGELSHARQLFARAAYESQRSQLPPLLNLLRACVSDEERGSAISLGEEIIAKWPGTSAAYVLLAGAYAADDQSDRAIQILNAGIASVPESDASKVQLYVVLGGVLTDELGKPEDAAAIMAQAFQRFPKNAMLANNLAYVYLMMDRVSEAEGVLSRARASTEAEGVVLTATRGLLRLKRGRLDEGVSGYEAAERKARAAGLDALARTVRQKMHLELARYHLVRGEVVTAAEHANAGIALSGKRAYRRALTDILSQTTRL